MKNFEKAQKYVAQLREIFSPAPEDINARLDRLIRQERGCAVAICNRVAAGLVAEGRRAEAEIAWRCAEEIRSEGERVDQLVGEAKDNTREAGDYG
jgi:hypothetical protein